MIATSHNMVHGALRTIIIHKKNKKNKWVHFNTSGPGKYGHRFVDNISKCISPMKYVYFFTLLYETKMALLTDVYVRHLASMS